MTSSIGTGPSQIPLNGMLGKLAFLDNITSSSNGISVISYGADPSGAADSYAAFQAACDALSAIGGRILVPEGTYNLSQKPNWGVKSVYWDISTGCSWTGAGTGGSPGGFGLFPNMNTNLAQVAVGPFIQSQSRQTAPTNGGIAALNVEMLQPADYTGQSVAIYCGARGSNPSPSANVWTINPLIQADVGAGGTYQCLEVDVNCFSENALVKAISINGVGEVNPDVAIEIMRTGPITHNWNTGINIRNCLDGIKIEEAQSLRGIVIGEPLGFVNSLISGKQYVNDVGNDMLIFQRRTDTAPAGNLLRLVNNANTLSLFEIDVSGNVYSDGNITAKNKLVAINELAPPAGTSAQRPIVPALGSMRFNSTIAVHEGWNGTSWAPFAGTGGGGTGVVTVVTYGADPTGVADSLGAFNDAIIALPAGGGKIIVPEGIFKLTAVPTIGTKSIYWDISPSTTWTGAGTGGAGLFPTMTTNTSQVAVGPYIRSQSSTAAPTGGGIAAFNIEMLQPSTTTAGQNVGLYVGASGSNPSTSANVWAINPLIRANAGAGGTYQCMEVDVDCYSATALVKGISINGVGDNNPDVGIEIMRTGSSTHNWNYGINVRNSLVGIKIEEAATVRGIVIGEPLVFTNSLISGRQLVNSAANDMIVLQRRTDTSPVGNFFRLTNAANTLDVFSVDVAGNTRVRQLVTGASILTGYNTSTEDANIELGNYRSSNGNAYIDFHSQAGTDYDFRVARWAGANGGAELTQNGTGDLVIQTVNAASMIFKTSSAEAMRLDTSGNLLLAKAQRFSQAGGSLFWIDNPTTSTMRFSSGASPGTAGSIYITNAGRLGIGTSAPGDALSVVGNIVATGDAGITGGITAAVVQAGNVRATAGAVSMGATGLSLGSTTATTASAGSATLPANPLGFLTAFVGATQIRIPYYNI